MAKFYARQRPAGKLKNQKNCKTRDKAAPPVLNFAAIYISAGCGARAAGGKKAFFDILVKT